MQIITGRLSTGLAHSASSLLQPADSAQMARNSDLAIPNTQSDSGFGRTISYMDATPSAKESAWLHGISSSKPRISNEHCSVCAQNSTMLHVPPEETKRRSMTDSESILGNHLCKSSAVIEGSRPATHTLEKSKQNTPRQKKIQPANSTFVKVESSNREISPCRDISYAIKRIETQILVLQHLSRLANPLESAGRQVKERETKIPSQIGNQTTRIRSSLPKRLREDSKSSTEMVGGAKIPMWSMSHVQASNARNSSQISNFMHGFRIPKSVTGLEMSPNQTVDKKSVRKVVQPTHFLQDEIHTVASASSSNRMLMRGENVEGHVNIHRPALVEQKIDNRRSSLGGNKTCKLAHPAPMNRKLALQVESEESSSGSQDSYSYSSSSTSSQQTNSSSSYTGEDDSRSYTDYTDFSRGSRSESEDGSSFSSESVPSPQGHIEPSLKKVIPTRRSRSLNSGGAIGKLRKIKNKLGLIFHHHHHHHHHHYDTNDKDRVHMSKWKNVGDNILHGANKNQVNGGRKIIGKSKKPVDKRSQGGHFHMLVEGLLRHIRHSKKELRPPNPNAIMRNSKKKKLHWWQMMRRHGGVKLPKGRRQPKLKLPKKRKQLRATK